MCSNFLVILYFVTLRIDRSPKIEQSNSTLGFLIPQKFPISFKSANSWFEFNTFLATSEDKFPEWEFCPLSFLSKALSVSSINESD